MHNNINVNVGGPVQASSTYKTVVLKGNIPFAEQIGDPNVKYVIKWDFDLGGESVTIPENCVLEFDGGSLSGGTLVGQGTSIIGLAEFKNIIFNGNFAEKAIDVKNINDLKASLSIYPGTIVNTLGYYQEGDGGNAQYVIRKKTDGDVETSGDLFELQNNLTAELIISDGYLNIKKFGCKTDTNFDNATKLQEVVDYCKLNSLIALIPQGNYLVNSTISLPNGTQFKGIEAYTYKQSCLYTTVKTNDFLMFKGVGNDIIRHIVFTGVTIKRTRTQEELDAISIGGQTGYGYGLAGTAFKMMTEGNFIKCGFVGWGSVFGGGSIVYSNGTDYAYCNHIIDNVSLASSFKISEANGWCLGSIIKTHTSKGIQDVGFDKCWFEYFNSIIEGETIRCINLNITNSAFTNYAYGDTSPYFNFTNTAWNRIFINIENCVLFVKNIISNNNINSTDNIIQINNSKVYYRNYNDGEYAKLYGNSLYYNTDNQGAETAIAGLTKKGIDTDNSEFHNGFKISSSLANLPTYSANNLWRIDRHERNLIWVSDTVGNRQTIPAIYFKSDNSMPKDENNTELAGPYFVWNRNAHDKGDIILKYKDNWGGVRSITRVAMSSEGNRPTLSNNGVDIGEIYYDRTINIPLYWDGDTWRNASRINMTNVTKLYGSKEEREALQLTEANIGFQFLDATLKQWILWDGTKWVDATGAVAGTPTSGTFANKPTVATNKIPVGFKYFCTDKQTVEGATNGIEIIHKGSNVWVDALGRVVS